MPDKKAWNENHQKRYNSLFNFFNSDEKPEWIKIKKVLDKDKYLEQITTNNLIKIIKRNDKWSISTKESYIFMIARYYQIHKPEEKEEIKFLQQQGYDLKVKREENEGENELDEKEKKGWRELQYFKDILNSIDPDKIETQREHNKYLLLSLLTLVPPLRTDYYLMARIARDYKDIEDDKNYILLIFRGKPRAYYIVNNDKVSNTRTYKNNQELSHIEIENNDVVSLLYESFDKYKRTFLFEQNGKNISDKTILKYLKEITKIPDITIDMMRSSFITDYHKKHKKYVEQVKLSRQMRHSFETSKRNYHKVLGTEEDELNRLKKENEELKEEIKKLKSQIEILKS